jgi:hypothetical protein
VVVRNVQLIVALLDARQNMRVEKVPFVQVMWPTCGKQRNKQHEFCTFSNPARPQLHMAVYQLQIASLLECVVASQQSLIAITYPLR